MNLPFIKIFKRTSEWTLPTTRFTIREERVSHVGTRTMVDGGDHTWPLKEQPLFHIVALL
jgi:hypothetical protein